MGEPIDTSRRMDAKEQRHHQEPVARRMPPNSAQDVTNLKSGESERSL